jgi:superfamily I DNA/RNA helicase/RecB family exonuclease
LSDAPYRLVRPPVVRPAVPALDDAQRAVADHRGGPLLVLAGPGTGKTTTLVEAVVARVEAGLDPERVLVLTFSRKAAGELRDRIAARLGRTTATPAASTFHAFCYALVRSHQSPQLYEHPLRLLSGAEQDVAVRELLAGTAETGRVRWPSTLLGCLPTRGLAEEVRDVIARSRERDVDLGALAAVASGEAAESWAALATFVDEYLDVLDAQGVVDYSELVRRAVALAEQLAVQAELREQFAVVFVDEYQDSDPAQMRLLRAIAGDGRDLVVFGDPDQSIYAFRGADLRGILDFPHEFPDRAGAPARTLVLRTSRRAGPGLLAASRALAARMPLSGLDAGAARAHRDLTAAPVVGRGAGRVDVLTFPSSGAELERVADVLRRAHLEDGVPWGDMAVLVRSGVRSIPTVRRVLSASGVPVEVAGDEIPLRFEPAVAPLLTALRCASAPDELTPEVARSLLLSPLGGADTADLRRLGRALRAEQRAEAEPATRRRSATMSTEQRAEAEPATRRRSATVSTEQRAEADGDQPMRSSTELVRDAVADPRRLVAHDDFAAEPAKRLGRLLAKARDVLASRGSAEEALWAIWSGTAWPRRLEQAALRGGPGGRRADRDLDAVCALFEAAARAEEKGGHRGVRNFLAEIAAQEIPSDGLAERAVRGDAVRILTAHRSKGLEWRLVAVVGVQEGVWPDLRRRGSLLEADRIGPDGLAPPPTVASVLAEERRLFYVAVTRAKERLLVTAVESPDEDGDQPSRFVRELGVLPLSVLDRPRRPLSLAGLVADLRAAAVDPEASQRLREAAALRLAALAAQTDENGHALVPAADPAQWWGLAELTSCAEPVRPSDRPLELSGSAVSKLVDCPLSWFLAREAHADSSRGVAMGFGSIVHALADDVARERTPADIDVLMKRLDRVWHELAFDARWQSVQQRDEARRALERFLAWHAAPRGRSLLATEHPFEVSIPVGEHAVVLRGAMDRVERDADGRIHVSDFKTGKSAVPAAAVARHAQLGVYQVAVAAGAVESLPGGGRECGGAELVQLRQEAKGGLPKVQAQVPLASDPDDPVWAERMLADAVRRVLGEEWVPLPGEDCKRCGFRRCCSARPEGRQVVE